MCNARMQEMQEIVSYVQYYELLAVVLFCGMFLLLCVHGVCVWCVLWCVLWCVFMVCFMVCVVVEFSDRDGI